MLKKCTPVLLFCLCFAINRTEAQCPYSATISGTTSICLLEITNLDINFTGGVPPYQIDLFTGANVFTINNYFPGQPISVSPFISTTYSLVEVRDAQNCQATVFGEAAITVIQLPSAFPAEISQCEEGGGLATFDLTSLDPIVNGATGFSVSWYISQSLSNPIPNPSNYTINTSIVYARIFDGVCHSSLVPVTLMVVDVPVGQSVVLEACDEGNGTSVFDLTSADQSVSLGTSNAVSWYEDVAGAIPISNPSNYVATDQMVYAIVADGTCESSPVAVTLISHQIPSPVISGNLFFCEDSSTSLIAEPGYASYTWSNGATTQSIFVSTAGIYSLSVTTVDGCIGTTSVEVLQSPNPTPIISGPSQICDNENVVLEASPGFSNYLWSDGRTTQNINVNSPGEYSVNVIDNQGCIGRAYHSIETLITLSCRETVPATNTFLPDGQGIVTITGGAPPYEITWDGPSPGFTSVDGDGDWILDNLFGGRYQVSVTDANQCLANCYLFVRENSVINNCRSATPLQINQPEDCDVYNSHFFSFDNFNYTTLLSEISLFPCLNGIQDTLLSDSWFRFTATGDKTRIALQNNSLELPYVALYRSANCYNPLPIKCDRGSDISFEVETTPGTEYFLMIAGRNNRDRSTFSFSIETKRHCASCILGQTLSATPLPVNGIYSPGDVVNFCYTISSWDFVGSAWFHALELQFGSGWDLSTLTYEVPENVCPDDWSWHFYWESCSTSQVFGPGFAAENELGSCDPSNNIPNMDPGNNFGCSDIGDPDAPPAVFCWTIQVANCSINSNKDLSVIVNPFNDAQSGAWDAAFTDCSTPSVTFIAQSSCILPLDLTLQTFNHQCSFQPGGAIVFPKGGSGTYAYQWSTGQNTPSITNLIPGQYSLTLSDGQSEVVQHFSIDSESILFIDLGPDLTLCQGDTHTIDATVIDCPGCTYTWSNGDTAASITVSDSGTYSVTVTDPEGCEAVDDIHITFQPPTNTNLSVSICEGESFNIGGQVFTQSGFYNLFFTSNIGCDSVVSLDLTVLPTTFTFLNAQVCEGEVFFVDNNAYDQAGQYQEILTSSFGCDSIVSLDLTVLDAIIYRIDTTILQGESVTIGDSTYDQEGIYYDTLFSASVFGCDSIIITDLSILIIDCNSAGTIYFEDRPDSDTVFLCFGDTLKVRHNGDFDLSGDPNPATAPGIGYAYYDCPPDTTGPTYTNILADLCLNHTSPIFVNGNPVIQSNYIWVTTGSNTNGDMNIVNDGLIQEAFNGGTAIPTQLWLAPITIDDFANSSFELDGNGNAGPCVSVSTVEAFSVVWLNEMVISNLEVNPAGCEASFQVSGGLAEWDASNYSISVTKAADPNISGEVISGPATHDGMVNFIVPESGVYDILVEDGKSCPAIASLDIDQPDPLIISCSAISPSELLFSWNVIDGVENYQVQVSNGSTFTVTETNYTITGLFPGESITIEVLPNYTGSCSIESASLTCVTNDCPVVNLEITQPGPFCADDPPYQLELMPAGGIGNGSCQWQGPLTSNGLFDPIVAGPGNHLITLICTEGPCEYIATITLTVFPNPVAAFNLENKVCLDGFGTTTFQGEAGLDAVYTWDFDGGTAVPGIGPGPHEISWSIPGLKTVSLSIEENGCVSETFSRNIEVETAFPAPNISCIGINDQLAFGWQPVPGATGYNVTVLSGQTGILNGNIFIVSNLEPSEEVVLEVVAINGGGVCSDSADTLSCLAEGDPIIMLTEPTFELDEANGTIQVRPEFDRGDFNIKGPYPNPTRQEAQVELSLQNQQAIEMALIDIRGRTIQVVSRTTFEKGNHSINIDTRDLAPALYFVKIHVANQVITKKLAVVK